VVRPGSSAESYRRSPYRVDRVFRCARHRTGLVRRRGITGQDFIGTGRAAD